MINPSGRLTWELHMANRVVSISSQTRVTPTKLHLGIHTRHFLLLPPLEAGSLWVQITLFEKKTYTLIKNISKEILEFISQERAKIREMERGGGRKGKWKVGWELQDFGRTAGTYFLQDSPFHPLHSFLNAITDKKHREVQSRWKNLSGQWLTAFVSVWKEMVGCLWGSDPPVLADLPRTCFSRPRMTWTACCRMTSLVWALSLCRWTWHILPSSLKASLISRTRTLSLALLARRRSRSLCSFSSAVRFSSVTETMLQSEEEGRRRGGWRGWLTNPDHNPHWT